MKKLFQPENIFRVFLVCLSSLFAFAVPPFQKPDEPSHFLKAMSLASGQLHCIKGSGKSYFILPDTVVNFPQTMHTGDIVMRYDAKFPVSLFKVSYPFRSDQSKNTGFSYCLLPTIGYIPYAVSVWISNPFDNLLVTFYSMRAAALVVFLFCFFLSAALIPSSYRLLLYLFAATPMVVHQATSVSYDAAFTSLLMVVVSLFVRYLKQKHVTLLHLFIISFLVTGLMRMKEGYYVFFLLPLFLLKKKKWTKMKPLFISVLLLLVLLPLLLKFSVLKTLGSRFVDPAQFIRALTATAAVNLGDYLLGLVGHFGWLDYAVSPLLYVFYFILFGVVFVQLIRRKDRLLTVFESSIFLVGIFVNILFIFYHFYRAATPPVYYLIFGMQGRYLLPFVPFLIISLISLVNGIGWSRVIKIGAICGSVILLWSFCMSMYTRYFDYSRVFGNPRYFETRIEKGEIPLTTTETILINKEMSFVYPVPIGRKIGGFQMLMTNELSVTTPYRYELKDKTCTKILRDGYLDALKDSKLSFLKGEKDIVYTQYTKIISLTEDAICLTLRPIIQRTDTTYLSLYEEDHKPTLEFLYIAK